MRQAAHRVADVLDGLAAPDADKGAAEDAARAQVARLADAFPIYADGRI